MSQSRHQGVPGGIRIQQVHAANQQVITIDPNNFMTEEALVPLLNQLQVKWDQNGIPIHHR